MNRPATYETDFHAWALQNASMLRQGRLDELDIEHIAEELEGMSASERRELLNRLQVLLLHLLKYQYQPERRGKSWLLTISHQRTAIERLLDYFDRSERTHLRIAPEDIGEKEVGHFAFFRSEYQDRLWPIALLWLKNADCSPDMPGSRLSNSIS